MGVLGASPGCRSLWGLSCCLLPALGTPVFNSFTPPPTFLFSFYVLAQPRALVLARGLIPAAPHPRCLVSGSRVARGGVRGTGHGGDSVRINLINLKDYLSWGLPRCTSPSGLGVGGVLLAPGMLGSGFGGSPPLPGVPFPTLLAWAPPCPG